MITSQKDDLPVMKDHLLCRDTFAWMQRCPYKTGRCAWFASCTICKTGIHINGALAFIMIWADHFWVSRPTVSQLLISYTSNESKEMINTLGQLQNNAYQVSTICGLEVWLSGQEKLVAEVCTVLLAAQGRYALLLQRKPMARKKKGRKKHQVFMGKMCWWLHCASQKPGIPPAYLSASPQHLASTQWVTPAS